jgi:hypothetical protein
MDEKREKEEPLFALESKDYVLGPYSYPEAIEILVEHWFAKKRGQFVHEERVWVSKNETVTIVPWEESSFPGAKKQVSQ